MRAIISTSEKGSSRCHVAWLPAVSPGAWKLAALRVRGQVGWRDGCFRVYVRCEGRNVDAEVDWDGVAAGLAAAAGGGLDGDGSRAAGAGGRAGGDGCHGAGAAGDPALAGGGEGSSADAVPAAQKG